jgi:hypothetical protein
MANTNSSSNVTPIESKQPAPVGAKFTIMASIDGFPVSVEVEGKADVLRSMIDRLKAIGAEPPVASAPAPAQSEPTKNEDTPVCEFHGKMKMGNYGWFCPKKMGDGSYCKSKA